MHPFSSVQSLSGAWLFGTHESQHGRLPCPSQTPSWLRLMSIEPVMPTSHLILCRPLLFVPPIPPRIPVFSNESTLRMRCPKCWSFSFSISPSKEISGLISFRMYWMNLLAVQGTLKSLLQHHSSKNINSLALPFFGIGMKMDLFQSCGHCWVFQICWYIDTPN